jgi:hypothetical protein
VKNVLLRCNRGKIRLTDPLPHRRATPPQADVVPLTRGIVLGEKKFRSTFVEL